MVSARRVRRVCTAMMLVYGLVAFARLAMGFIPLYDASLLTARVQCIDFHCALRTDDARLLPEVSGRIPNLSRARTAELERFLDRPRTKAALFAGEAVHAIPAFLLFLSLAAVSRAFARAQGYAPIIRWLRRAAAWSLALVFAKPVSDTIRATALSPFRAGGERISICFDANPFFWGLLLAGAAWVSVWALDQARRTEAELAEIV